MYSGDINCGAWVDCPHVHKVVHDIQLCHQLAAADITCCSIKSHPTCMFCTWLKRKVRAEPKDWMRDSLTLELSRSTYFINLDCIYPAAQNPWELTSYWTTPLLTVTSLDVNKHCHLMYCNQICLMWFCCGQILSN